MPGKLAKFLGWGRTELREGRRTYLKTDLGNAERFVGECRGKAMWCGARKAWLVWDGTRWVWDDRKHIVRLAHQVARGIFSDAQHTEDQEEQKRIAAWAMKSQSEARINAMISQAAPYLVVGVEELDTDPWVLNCQNGTLDLKTGVLKKHNPEDRITKIVPVEYNPDAKAPRFEKFLEETLVDGDVVSFIKRFSGYTLTGVTRERVMAILYGFGKNGKSTLIELLQETLGDYSTNTEVETLLLKRGGGVPNDVAALKGARFVSAAEVEKGRRLAESKVKQLTGSDTVTARFLYGELFDFRPEFKLWLSTNHKPEIRGTDDAIWDRIRLIPFTQRFEGSKADPNLPETLRGERAGVLAWLVEGCLEWQEHGLDAPEAVTAATAEYRSEMDTLAAFFEEHCVIAPNATVPATPLYDRYKLWCDDVREAPEKQKSFGARLKERGFESFQFPSGPHRGRSGWRGIGFSVEDPDPDDDEKCILNVKNEPKTEANPRHNDQTVEDPRQGESGLGIGNGHVGVEGVEDCRPKNNKNRLDQAHVRKVLKPSSTSSTTASKDHVKEPPQRPLSFDAVGGEMTTLKKLENRRNAEGSPEAKRLIEAGWTRRDRGDNSFWTSPDGTHFAMDVALDHLDRQRGDPG
jgi:putative DNA primase/helicase